MHPNERRKQVLSLLAQGPKLIAQIYGAMGVSRQDAHYILYQLEDRGEIESRLVPARGVRVREWRLRHPAERPALDVAMDRIPLAPCPLGPTGTLIPVAIEDGRRAREALR